MPHRVFIFNDDVTGVTYEYRARVRGKYARASKKHRYSGEDGDWLITIYDDNLTPIREYGSWDEASVLRFLQQLVVD